LGILLSSILSKWPIQLILLAFTNLTISSFLNILSISSLFLVLHSFYMTNPAYPSCLHKPNYTFFS
jgi:hypothetical protein